MHLNLYVDGGVLGGKNPGTAVYWSVAREHEGGRIELLTERAEDHTRFTNNDAEYLALIDALTHAAKLDGVSSVRINSDSQLIVNQFNGRWKIGEARLMQLCAHARDCATFLINGGIPVEVTWVRRQENVKRLGH